MALERVFEQDVWCAACHEHMGEVWSALTGDNGTRTYFTKPLTLPKYCPRCENVIERRYH